MGTSWHAERLIVAGGGVCVSVRGGRGAICGLLQGLKLGVAQLDLERG
jgi:hypothetical protein